MNIKIECTKADLEQLIKRRNALLEEIERKKVTIKRLESRIKLKKRDLE